jgi:hypothetical protein
VKPLVITSLVRITLGPSLFLASCLGAAHLATKFLERARPVPTSSTEAPMSHVRGKLLWLAPAYRIWIRSEVVSTLPSESVVLFGGEWHFFVDRGFGGYEARPLAAGFRQGERIVVSDGAFLLKSELLR